MLQITINVNATPVHAQMIKEDLAMYLERYGDSRVVSVTEPFRNQQPQVKQQETSQMVQQRLY